MQLISERLRRRTATAGADPLVTYYDLVTGERTELSGITVTNWVAKTCHLLTDEYGLDVGDVVLLDVARTHPGHWVTSCLELACWTLGVAVAANGAEAGTGNDPAGGRINSDSAGGRINSDPAGGRIDNDGVRLVVAGPLYSTAAARAADLGADLLACSLHPLGLPFAEKLPDRVADFSLEVRGQPDQFSGAGVPADQPAWRSAEASLTQADLAAVDGSAGRRLVRPTTPWATARDGIVAALLGGGSVVVAVGDDEAALDRIRATENIETEVA